MSDSQLKMSSHALTDSDWDFLREELRSRNATIRKLYINSRIEQL